MTIHHEPTYRAFVARINEQQQELGRRCPKLPTRPCPRNSISSKDLEAYLKLSNQAVLIQAGSQL